MRFGTRTLVLIASLSLLSCTAAFSQSGRRKQETPVPAPTATPSSRPANSTGEPAPTHERITALIVTAYISHGFKYMHTSYDGAVIKEFIDTMKSGPGRLFMNISKGGKMDWNGVKQRAKNETNAHTIWLEVVTSVDGLGEMVVERLNYAILVPRTGAVLVRGEVIAGEQRIVHQGGVLKIPSMQRRRSAFVDMMQCARQLAYRMKSTGWF